MADKVQIDRDELVKVIKSTRDGWRSPASVLPMLNLVVIAVAGAWVAYIHFSIEEGLAELKTQKSKIELDTMARSAEESVRPHIEQNQTLQITDLGPRDDSNHLYSIEWQYHVKNIGTLPVEITCIQEQIHHASEPTLNTGTPIDVNLFAQLGPFVWQHSTTKETAKERKNDFSCDNFFTEHLGGVEEPGRRVLGNAPVGRLQPGELNYGGLSLLFVGKPTDWIGFACYYLMNGGGAATGDLMEADGDMGYIMGFHEAKATQP